MFVACFPSGSTGRSSRYHWFFTVAGLVLALGATGMTKREVSRDICAVFNGATRHRLRALKGQAQLPFRLLLLG